MPACEKTSIRPPEVFSGIHFETSVLQKSSFLNRCHQPDIGTTTPISVAKSNWATTRLVHCAILAPPLLSPSELVRRWTISPGEVPDHGVSSKSMVLLRADVF